MKITKIWIDEKKKKCTICGMCELIAPAVFKVTDKTHINKNVNIGLYESEIRDAVESCPQDIIKIAEKR